MLEPGIGSPPITTVDQQNQSVVCLTASGQRAGTGNDTHLPGL